MLKTSFAICLLFATIQGTAHAACSSQDAMTKRSDVSEVLSAKLQTKTDDASKMMFEMGDIVGTGAISDQTCVKLDALLVRAKKL